MADEISRDNVPTPQPLRAALGLDDTLVAGLPPDVRDLLLDTVLTWGAPQEALDLAARLREAHGPLLLLLDVQAQALAKQGDFAAAQEVNERRQRRSGTIAAQALEARTLLALGHTSHARDVAHDLAETYPRARAARLAAAEVFAAGGDFAQARTLLEEYLAHHPGDPQTTLTLARLALAAGEQALAAQMAERLGAGVPADLPDAEMDALAALLDALGRRESAHAVRLERTRRRQAALDRLAAALAPFTALDPSLRTDSGAVYRQLNGPEAVPMTREEQRRVQLEAMRHFGFAGLREGQAETVASVLRGESVLAVMPTGAGKSLCYQLPALTLPRASLVISPLIALMKDQVESLPSQARSKATFINSTLSDEEMAERLQDVAAGHYKLIYAAPERLRQREFLRVLRQSGLDLFVIDEAHCVSLWGHDFRPDYLFLQEARRELGSPATLAMTATAPPRVRDEVLDFMRPDPSQDEERGAATPPRVITLDIFRSNLHLSALKFHNDEGKKEALLKFAAETEGSGIVYVNTRVKSEALAMELQRVGVAAEAYHAGLANRGEVQDRFMSDQTRVVVATVAFGMGIDKADIRFIVHFDPSRSLAGYYQEVGRAGRDGKPSQGVLYSSSNDWANLRRWARADTYDLPFLRKVYDGIAAQLGGAAASAAASEAASKDGAARGLVSGAVEIVRLQRAIGADSETDVRVGISVLERADLLTRGFDVTQEVTVQLPRRLPAAAREDADFADLLRGLALSPGQTAHFKLAAVADFMGWNQSDCEMVLLDWQEQGLLNLKMGRRAMFIELPPTPEEWQQRLARLVEQSLQVAGRRIDDITGYATTEGCRHGYISAHFGSPPRSRCNVCDNCTGIRPEQPPVPAVAHLLPDESEIEPLILDCLISLPRPVGRSGLARILTGHLRAPVTPDKARHHGALKGLGESGVMESIDELLESNRLRQYERQGFLVLAPTLSGRTEAEIWLAEHPELGAYGEAPPPVEEGPNGDEPPPDADRYTGLQKALWLWRRRLAEELGQPPYVIMSNELMLQIAETRPASLEELAALPGMGPQRLDHYGPTVLDLVQLNPPAEGDAALLAAQRAALADAKASGAVAAARRAGVSPQLEKRIFMKMQEIRQKVAIAERLKPGETASNTLLKEIARAAPATLDELDAIPGFRTSALREQGPQILTFIAAARAREG